MDTDAEVIDEGAANVAQWEADVTAVPLERGVHSWAVTALKQLLAAAGTDVGNDTVEYDDALAAVVGDTFDGAAASALLARL